MDRQEEEIWWKWWCWTKLNSFQVLISFEMYVNAELICKWKANSHKSLYCAEYFWKDWTNHSLSLKKFYIIKEKSRRSVLIPKYENINQKAKMIVVVLSKMRRKILLYSVSLAVSFYLNNLIFLVDSKERVIFNFSESKNDREIFEQSDEFKQKLKSEIIVRKF